MEPIGAAERIVAIDTLRGVAVLGILVMNIYAFAMPFPAYNNPLLWGGTEWYNLGTWFVTHVFFDQKFMTIFSLLFGAGIVIISERAAQRGNASANFFLRRQLWLGAIGAAHGYLLWVGDILFAYAVVGAAVLPFQALPPRRLMAIAVALLAVAPLLSFTTAGYVEELQQRAAVIAELEANGETLNAEQRDVQQEWSDVAPFLSPGAAEVQEDLAAYRGRYFGIVAFRAPTVASLQTDAMLFFILWRVGGLMLLGMAAMKLNVLSAERPARFYRQMQLIGYGIGLPLTLFSAYDLYAHQWNGIYVLRAGMLSNYVGSLLVAAGHIATVMLAVKSGFWPKLMARFSAVGRMALTNYLAHSVILTSVFYGYGLGLYGHVPRLVQMTFVAAVIGLQLAWSPEWLSRFRFGPCEWLWRSLTYGRRQPMQPSA